MIKQLSSRQTIGLSLLFLAWLLSMGWLFIHFTPDESRDSLIEQTGFKEKDGKINVAYTPEEIQEAQNIFASARRYADIYEEGSHLVVELKNYVNPEDILNLVRSIADADCVLTRGRSRNIYFYDPGNKQIAYADFSCTDL